MKKERGKEREGGGERDRRERGGRLIQRRKIKKAIKRVKKAAFEGKHA